MCFFYGKYSLLRATTLYNSRDSSYIFFFKGDFFLFSSSVCVDQVQENWQVPRACLMPRSVLGAGAQTYTAHKPILSEVPYHGCACDELLSHVKLFATPWTVAHQIALSMGTLQARILQWVAVLSSRRSSPPRDQTQVPALQAISLPSEPPDRLPYHG